MNQGPASFRIVVPATPSGLINDFNMLSGAFPVDAALEHSGAVTGESQAQTRLDTELGRLQAIGARASGAVGDPDPVAAIDAALAEESVDEILLSTLPPGPSRWLAMDTPSCIRRHTDLPLTVLISDAEDATVR